MAFFAGEFLTLRYKDKRFQNKVKKTKGLEKFKIIFEGLVDFNKELVVDAKKIDVKASFLAIKQETLAEIKTLNIKLTDLEKKRTTLSQEKIKPLLIDAEEQYLLVANNIDQLQKEFREKYQLDQKLKEVKAKITQLKRRKLS